MQLPQAQYAAPHASNCCPGGCGRRSSRGTLPSFCEFVNWATLLKPSVDGLTTQLLGIAKGSLATLHSQTRKRGTSYASVESGQCGVHMNISTGTLSQQCHSFWQFHCTSCTPKVNSTPITHTITHPTASSHQRCNTYTTHAIHTWPLAPFGALMCLS